MCFNSPIQTDVAQSVTSQIPDPGAVGFILPQLIQEELLSLVSLNVH